MDTKLAWFLPRESCKLSVMNNWLRVEGDAVTWPHEAVVRTYVDTINMQRDINAKFRSILIDWLLEVATKFRVSPGVVPHAAAIIDVFLCRKVIMRDRLQLLGIAAFLIACKIDEYRAPGVAELVRVSCRNYSREEILTWESLIGITLHWRFNIPTAYDFVHIISEVAAELYEGGATSADYVCFAQGCVRLACEFDDLRPWLPSAVGVAVVFLSRVKCGLLPHWTSSLAQFSGYGFRRPMPWDCVRKLRDMCGEASSRQLKAALVDHMSASQPPAVADLDAAIGSYTHA